MACTGKDAACTTPNVACDSDSTRLACRAFSNKFSRNARTCSSLIATLRTGMASPPAPHHSASHGAVR